MKLQLHTGSRTVTIGADFLVWDMPCQVVLTDPWQLREAREVLRRELTELDRAVRPVHAASTRRRAAAADRPRAAFPYGVTTAPPNGVVHHRLAALDGLETGRGRRRPLHLDPGSVVDGGRRSSAAPRRWPRRRAAAYWSPSAAISPSPASRRRAVGASPCPPRPTPCPPSSRSTAARCARSGCPPAARCASSSSPPRRGRSSRCGGTSSCSAPPRPPPTPPPPEPCCAGPSPARGSPRCGLGARLVDAAGAAPGGRLLARPHRHPRRTCLIPATGRSPRPGVAWEGCLTIFPAPWARCARPATSCVASRTRSATT